jgi:hypothetical protein
MPVAGWTPTIKQCQHWWPLASPSHHIHQTCPFQNSLPSMVIKYEPFRHWVLGKLSLGVRRLQREAGHLRQSSSEIRISRTILPLSHMPLWWYSQELLNNCLWQDRQ